MWNIGAVFVFVINERGEIVQFKAKNVCILLILVFHLSLFFFHCQKPRAPSEPDPDPQPTWVADTTLIPQIIAQVDSSRIRNTIQTLQDFGTRYNYSPKCYEAAEWIKGELESYGYESEYQSFFNNRFFDIEFVDENNGWIAARSGSLLRTADGGQNWEIIDLGIYENIHKIYFLDDLNGWVWGTTHPYIVYHTLH